MNMTGFLSIVVDISFEKKKQACIQHGDGFY
jgi:hypothetical protein